MKLYIIGNGFDSHNLFETDYKNYRAYLENSYKADSMYHNIVKRSEEYLYTSFRYSDTWSDVENNLKFNYKEYFDHYCYCFNKPRSRSGEPLPNIDESILNQFWNNNFSKDLPAFTGECYYEWIKDTYVKRFKENIANPEDIAFLQNNQDDLFINFNYTSTLQDIYKVPEKNILHIHGKLSDVDENNLRIDWGGKHGSRVTEIRSSLVRVMQFGSINNDPKKIRKELSRIRVTPKNSLFNIKDLLDNIEYICFWSYKDIRQNCRKMRKFIKSKTITDVVIMGHSYLGIDEPYYTDILVPELKSRRWTFYCYSKTGVNQDGINAKKFTDKYGIILSDNPFPKW